MAIDLERSSSQWIDLGLSLPMLNAASAATVMGWLTLESAVGTMGFFAFAIGPPPGMSATSRYALEIRSTRIPQTVVRPDDVASFSELGIGALTIGTRHHVGCSVDIANDTTRLYIDGVEDSNFSPAYIPTAWPASNSKNAALGAKADGSSELMDGIIEDMRAYNRIVTPKEFAAIFHLNGLDNIRPDHRYLLNEGHDGKTASGVGTAKDIGSRRQDAEPKAAPVYVAGGLRFRRKVA